MPVDFAERRPAVPEAFLKDQAEASAYLDAHPVAAAESVAKATGLAAEVVYSDADVRANAARAV